MTQKDRVLLALQEGPKTLAELCSIPGLAHKLNSRIYDLRQEGYDIRHHKLKGCRHLRCQEYPFDCPAQMRSATCYKLHAASASQAAPRGGGDLDTLIDEAAAHA